MMSSKFVKLVGYKSRDKGPGRSNAVDILQPLNLIKILPSPTSFTIVMALAGLMGEFYV